MYEAAEANNHKTIVLRISYDRIMSFFVVVVTVVKATGLTITYHILTVIAFDVCRIHLGKLILIQNMYVGKLATKLRIYFQYNKILLGI